MNMLYVAFIFFFIGLIGVFLIRNNIILILLCLELISISIIIFFSFASLYLDNLIGQSIVFFILLSAAAEISFGLVLVTLLFFSLKSYKK